MGFSFRTLSLFSSVFLNYHLRIPKGNAKQTFCNAAPLGFPKFQSLRRRPDLENSVLIFNAEKILLRSPSMFPYFMLVAFEAGSLIRALILFILYPFISLCREDFALKVMVMISFVGLKKERFIEGRAVLPKFFLEDVAIESFAVLRKGKTTVAISDLPQVMVESFLRDYLAIDFVVGRNLKSFRGHFVGLMEERRNNDVEALITSPDAVGISCSRKCFDCKWFSNCKEIYLVREEERSKWHQLPRDSYPKPLIFHDGRLAFRPTFLATLAMFMWLPMGLALGILRITVSLTMPDWIRFPILHLTGVQIKVFNSKNLKLGKDRKRSEKGVLYVCNHRTLLDPLVLSYCLKITPTAVVYSLSRISEIIAPIKTVRLTRNRDQDAALMQKLLSQGSLVVCPEGTTCREPYLLRFSPLFTEITDSIYPVAIDCYGSMFYGTTARGLKGLDPLFMLMNPFPSASAHFLDMVQVGGAATTTGNGADGEISKYEMANMVQNLIAKELGFTCTRLTRKDKYLILAGNEGLV